MEPEVQHRIHKRRGSLLHLRFNNIILNVFFLHPLDNLHHILMGPPLKVSMKQLSSAYSYKYM